jgi:hypothetical protein
VAVADPAAAAMPRAELAAVVQQEQAELQELQTQAAAVVVGKMVQVAQAAAASCT